MTKRKVCVVTGSRSDYDLFFPVLKKIIASCSLKLQIIATSSHLSIEHGMTVKKIEEDGFFLDDKIDNLSLDDTSSSIAKSTGLATMLLSDSFNKLKPDVILLLGDRFETHAAATAAMLMNIPIAHIHGGEITEGAIDEKIRHSITKMSVLHFCSNEVYRRRLIQMGEDPQKVFNSGAPAIDNILNCALLSIGQLEVDLNFTFHNHKTALITFHPETLSMSNLTDELGKMFGILKESKLNIIFTYANADSGGRLINEMIEVFCKSDISKYIVYKNLGMTKYLSLMSHVDLLIGNTSSGIIEAASFKKPVVNIGSRQKGRIRNLNVVDSEMDNLKDSINLALSKDFANKIHGIKNIYGDGLASEIIVKRLEDQELSVRKVFFDQT
tara:strand:- start:1076 stop:2227 length:1152 start_codon:yes stop_codon:yes gene_type:complete